jgi:Tfp pilus assembly protein FimT
MLILLAVMVPRLRPMMEQRRIREASRTVSGFFYAARSRAMETGRPVGVALERLASQPEACIALKIVGRRRGTITANRINMMVTTTSTSSRVTPFRAGCRTGFAIA